jgi:hypothetical protein
VSGLPDSGDAWSLINQTLGGVGEDTLLFPDVLHDQPDVLRRRLGEKILEFLVVDHHRLDQRHGRRSRAGQVVGKVEVGNPSMEEIIQRITTPIFVTAGACGRFVDVAIPGTMAIRCMIPTVVRDFEGG